MLTIFLLFVTFLKCVHFTECTDVIFGYEVPSKNLLDNWNFENDISDDDWMLRWGKGALVSGGHTGRYAIKISKRTNVIGGVYQQVQRARLKKNTNYYFSIFIKLLSKVPDNQYSMIRVYASIWFSKSVKKAIEIGKMPYIAHRDGLWKQIGGDFKTPNEDFNYIEFYVRVDPLEVDSYLLDTASLIELERRPNWPAYLDTKINKHRKSDLTVKVDFPSSKDLGKSRIHVVLTRHEFGFGMALKSLLFNRNAPVNQNYRNFILNNFNWAVWENDLKWAIMEALKGNIQFDKVDQAMEVLLKNNFTLRGHAIDWDIMHNNPLWITDKKGSSLEAEINRRIDYLLKHFKGKFAEWDVCNEYLHKHDFENATGYIDMLEKQLKRAAKKDPNTKLFLNDYEVLRNGKLTSAIANLARYLLDKKIPIHGIGAQGHLRILPMDLEVVEKRVQIAASAGLPVSVTELSFHSYNMRVRADAVNMIMRVFYSEPGVTSTTLWGFSDEYGFSFSDDMYLTTGEDMRPNAAGQRLLDLIKDEWNTTKQFTPSRQSFTTTFPATHGNYKLIVTTKGQVVGEKDFYVSKGGNSIKLVV